MKTVEQVVVDTLEAESTGLGDGREDEQEEKDGDGDDFPRCGSGNSVDGGPLPEKRATGGGWADGREEEGRSTLDRGRARARPGEAAQQTWPLGHSRALYRSLRQGWVPGG